MFGTLTPNLKPENGGSYINQQYKQRNTYNFRRKKRRNQQTVPATEFKLFPAIVIEDLVIGNRSRVLNDRSADRIDPILLLLLRIGDEIHGVAPSGELEGELAMEDVLGALDGEAIGDGDDAAGAGGAGDGGLLEPEELPLLQHEPAAAPGLDVLALLGEPAGALGRGPELDAVVVVGVGLGGAHRRSPQAHH